MSVRVVMITGAAGFVGRHTVAVARARGFLVRAVVRRRETILEEWQADEGITPVICDLSENAPDMAGVDCVIHTAASLTGDTVAQMRGTTIPTEILLSAIARADTSPHLVLVSSITVYDTMALSVNATVDEKTPLEPEPDQRDAYCRAKLHQELQVTSAADRDGFALTIMRPGAIFGAGRLWNGHIGVGLGPIVLRFGTKGQIPTCAVTHCAKALVRAVGKRPADGVVDVVNILDDDRPNRERYMRVMRSSGWPKFIIVLPWRVLDILAIGLSWLPVSQVRGLLRRRVLHARLKPLKYSNARLRDHFGVESDDWFEALMLRAIDPDVFGVTDE